MSQSLSAVYVHLVFGTHNREPWFEASFRPRLWSFVGGILENCNCYPLAIGGMAEHLHLETDLSRSISMSDLVKKVKTGSTHWLKSLSREYSSFSWQGGYGIFSVSHADRLRVRQYILNQEKHHQNITYVDELVSMLQRANIPFDEKYLL